MPIPTTIIIKPQAPALQTQTNYHCIINTNKAQAIDTMQTLQ